MCELTFGYISYAIQKTQKFLTFNIREKWAGLVSPFFSNIKSQENLTFFYCIADVAKCLNPVFSISYLSLQNGNFLNFFHAQLQSICYVAVCIQSIPKYLKNFNFSIQCTKHIRTKTYLRLHIFSCISICIICICKQNTTAYMNTEDF